MKTALFVGMITIAATAWAQAPPPTKVQDSQSSVLTSQAIGADKSEAAVDEPPEAVLEAELTRGLDTRKLHVGDPVLARCTQDFRTGDEVLVPRKSKLIGHVAEVQEKSKSKVESTLRIVWDKALLRDGREVPLIASIQAIAPPVLMVANDGEEPILGNRTRSRPPAASVVVRHLNPTATSHMHSPGESNGTAVDSALGSKTTGVVDIRGLQLNSTSSSYKGSVIHSSSQNVRLESGTRLILRVTLH